MRLWLPVTAAGVALFAASWTLWGPAFGGSGQSLSMEQNAAQEELAGEPAPACGDAPGDRLGMANPAATYCKELGYQYRTAQTNKGEQGICVFPDGGECEEWTFLAGKCGKERSYCAKQGLDLVTKNDGKNSLSREYAECVDGSRRSASVSELMGLSEKATRSSLPVSGERTPSRSSAPHRHSSILVRLAERRRPKLDDLRQEPGLMRLLLGVFGSRRRRRDVQRRERQFGSRP